MTKTASNLRVANEQLLVTAHVLARRRVLSSSARVPRGAWSASDVTVGHWAPLLQKGVCFRAGSRVAAQHRALAFVSVSVPTLLAQAHLVRAHLDVLRRWNFCVAFAEGFCLCESF